MAAHPTCDVIPEYYTDRTFFSSGDDLKGKIRIKTTVDGQIIKH